MFVFNLILPVSALFNFAIAVPVKIPRSWLRVSPSKSISPVIVKSVSKLNVPSIPISVVIEASLLVTFANSSFLLRLLFIQNLPSAIRRTSGAWGPRPQS